MGKGVTEGRVYLAITLMVILFLVLRTGQIKRVVVIQSLINRYETRLPFYSFSPLFSLAWLTCLVAGGRKMVVGWLVGWLAGYSASSG